MKRNLTLVLAATCFAMSSFAQSPVVVTDHDGNVVNGTSVLGWGPAGSFELSVSLRTESDENFNQIVNVKRYELNVVDSTKNMFCWGVCYNPIWADSLPLWVSDDWVNMDPDSVYEAFHAYYRPMGRQGVMCFRYVWFSTSDPNDSTWVDVCFNTMTGIGETAGTLASFNAYPNPAIGSDITIEHVFEGNSSDRELVLMDLLGNVVLRRTIPNGQGSTRIGASLLNAGVYFATLRENGSVLATRRISIATH